MNQRDSSTLCTTFLHREECPKAGSKRSPDPAAQTPWH